MASAGIGALRAAWQKHPLVMRDAATGEKVATFHAPTEVLAVEIAAMLTGGRYVTRVESPGDDSDLCVTDAVARARELGDPTQGDGWRRLLWRMADMLEGKG